MKVNEVLPSTYLEAMDIDRPITLVIESIEGKHKGKGLDGKEFIKPLIRFKGAKKGWVLNRTNAKRIVLGLGFGTEMDGWIGKQITIYPTTCNAFGKKDTPCIRVMLPQEDE